MRTLLMAFVLGIPMHARAEDRPNVVLIVVDDLGYGELGCQGNSEVPTPHIDSIAAEGIRFTSGYVTASYCSPSRAGLLTGRDQNRFGCDLNPVGALNDQPGVGLPASELTLASHLRSAGYATALIGKWHLGGTSPHHPMRHGFDTFFGFRHEGHYYTSVPHDGMVTWLRRRTLPDGGTGRWIRPDGRLAISTHMGHDEPPYDADNPMLRDGQPVEVDGDLTEVFSREAVAFIRRHAERPFFLCLAYNAVHSPMQARVEDVERFSHLEDIQRRIFAGMLSRLDQGVGQVLEALRDERLDRRTLVVFVSDNGGATRELTSSNRPLRGGKGDFFEGGLRVPFLARWVGHLPAGQVEPRPVSTLDLFPTICDASGFALPEDRTFDGINLLPMLTEAVAVPEDRVLWWRMGPLAAIRVGDWKLVRDQRSGPESSWQLFDLASDPAETLDRAAEHPEVVESLAQLWNTRNAEMPPPSTRMDRRR
ncbi:sulfatase-like hydrolase/transferase [Tautonia rosea]|uniref:sulfatase-like hydrolase/transferase n=1 Tax=Tautonia rosea TaxID=2728037 RepID=UPI0019D007AB|nr:sulfatase-like hydrolase/transferase [Tautonia rosea]